MTDLCPHCHQTYDNWPDPVCPHCRATSLAVPGTGRPRRAREKQNRTSATLPNLQPTLQTSSTHCQSVDPAAALQLYNLLREKPIFVDWYVSSFNKDRHSWNQKAPPLGAFLAKFAAHIVICVILSLTGVGLIVSIPYALIVSLLWFGEREGYKVWRDAVDSLLWRLGAGGNALIEQAPRTGGFEQFFHALKQYSSISQQVSDAQGSSTP